jgi:repressor LexA
MTFGEKLKKYREEKSLTQEELATLLDTTKQVISRYERSQRSPKLSKALEISKKLNIPSSYLLDDSKLNEHTSNENIGFFPVGTMYRIPIIGSVRCGFGHQAIQEIVGHDYASVKNPEEYTFFEVKGDSMMPKIEESDLALIHIQPDVESGELAVVIINGDEGSLKKVIKQGESIILQSFNLEYPPKIFSGEELNTLCIFGKVVETKKKW